MSEFDFDAAFGENYLHFYLPMLHAERSAAEAEEIVETLGLKPGDRVLDAPCGHGRISNLLQQKGLLVTGIDRSALFLEKAAADASLLGGQTPRYLEGDLRQLPIASEEAASFDAVVCWFTSFGYFDDDGNRQVLREFRRALKDGGNLLIETIHRDAFVRYFTPAPFANVTRAGTDESDLEIDTSVFDSESGSIRTKRTIVRDGEVATFGFTIRLPALTELRAWLESAGFSAVQFQSRNGQPLGLETRRLVVLATA